MNKNPEVVLNGIDFLIMAQNGTLKVDFDEKGNITGINLADEIIANYDGMLVALHTHTNSLMDSKYTVLPKPKKPVEVKDPVDTTQEN